MNDNGPAPAVITIEKWLWEAYQALNNSQYRLISQIPDHAEIFISNGTRSREQSVTTDKPEASSSLRVAYGLAHFTRWYPKH